MCLLMGMGILALIRCTRQFGGPWVSGDVWKEGRCEVSGCKYFVVHLLYRSGLCTLCTLVCYTFAVVVGCCRRFGIYSVSECVNCNPVYEYALVGLSVRDFK
jgi:hypothetical protein